MNPIIDRPSNKLFWDKNRKIFYQKFNGKHTEAEAQIIVDAARKYAIENKLNSVDWIVIPENEDSTVNGKARRIYGEYAKENNSHKFAFISPGMMIRVIANMVFSAYGQKHKVKIFETRKKQWSG